MPSLENQDIETPFPSMNKKWKWISIITTLFISTLLTLIGIHYLNSYGIALFFIIPLMLGMLPNLIYGQMHTLTLKQCYKLGFLTLTLYCLGLICFAIEGLICILMAAPIALLLTWLATYAAYAIMVKMPEKSKISIILLLLSFPTISFIEKDQAPTLHAVTSSIEIAATPSEVWPHDIEFPELATPTEFIFKTGIAYPINAKIEGAGVGAIRHCNFTTGSFVEPITVWDEPNLLKFSVLEQPAPMKEISFYDLDAPHLHDYFVSKEGQFKLIALPNGHTRLEGTTWYYHNIRPAFYWRPWSDMIIHQIHQRVLSHIKINVESKNDKIFMN